VEMVILTTLIIQLQELPIQVVAEAEKAALA
jgi:hypothetical protein